jgi:multiple sugar transport system ATP-binding protein
MSELLVKNLTKNYGALEVLHDINLSIQSGEFIVLVGPSGCGKSTLLNVIAGLEHATSGDLEIAGKRVNDMSPAERNIAMVFQSYALYPAMTVRNNIGFGMECRGVPRKERAAAIENVARMLGLEELLARKPSQLSGGQRQRVAMARALVREPSLFLFDEPLSNLDASLRVSMRREIKDLHQRVAQTMIYVTHDQIEAMTMATRIAVMRGGTVQQFGRPSEIYNEPETLFVARFMGAPSMNTFDARLAVEAKEIQLTSGCETPASFSIEKTNLRSPVSSDQKLVVGIRPENIHLVGQDHIAEEAQFQFSGTAVMIEPTGSEDFVTLRVADTPMVAKLPPGSISEIGGKFRFVTPIKHIRIFDSASEHRLF